LSARGVVTRAESADADMVKAAIAIDDGCDSQGADVSSNARGRGQRLERVETRVELRSATPRRAGSDRDRRAEAVGCGGGRRANGAFVRRREGLNHGRSLLHVTCRMPRRIRGREHTPEFGWIEDFSSQGRSVTPGFSRFEFFFFDASAVLARCSCWLSARLLRL
jgi:hypothetical protein